MAEDTTQDLKLKQELFCRAYTREGTDTFDNATTSYAEAYGYDFASLSEVRELDVNKQEIQGTSEREKAYHYCQTAGSRLMLNDDIRERIKVLMIELFDDDSIIDKRLTSIVITGKDADAINAIKHRNDLKARIIKKVDISTLGRPFGTLSDEELQKIANGGTGK